jgi:hypothetical protein
MFAHARSSRFSVPSFPRRIVRLLVDMFEPYNDRVYNLLRPRRHVRPLPQLTPPTHSTAPNSPRPR